MRRFIILYLVLCIQHANLYSQEYQFAETPTWEEDFLVDGQPDSTWFNYATNARYRGSLEYDDNLSKIMYVKDGCLWLIADKKQRHGTFIEPIVNTRNKKNFQYGKLEVRAKCPTGKGIWPAIWMIKPTKSYPNGEIDILEYIHCYKSKKYQANVQTYIEKDNGRSKQNQCLVEAKVSKWHVYSLEWSRESLKFLLDGKLVHEYTKQGHLWPFDEPYFLILNIAYGGWGGSCGMSDDIFPCKMAIDWIKYYKLVE